MPEIILTENCLFKKKNHHPVTPYDCNNSHHLLEIQK